jgi:hypothetical protein
VATAPAPALLIDALDELRGAGLEFLRQFELAAALGAGGGEHVRENQFLPRRLLLEELELLVPLSRPPRCS